MATIKVNDVDKPISLSAITDESGRIVALTSDNELFVSLPLDLFTDGGTGPSRRIRVDVAQTGFFAGREFRTFHELNMTDTQVVVIKAVVAMDTILFGLDAILTSGQLRVETLVGGTEGGAFSTALPIFGRNNMTERPAPFYEAQNTLHTGGTHTGGTVLDILLNKTADNANFAGSVGVGVSDERGIAANTYYFRLTATGLTTGVFKARWEERV